MTLCGSAAVPAKRVGRYALGVLRAGELHLTPLRGAVQVRPSFEYLAHKAAGERQTRLAAARSGRGKGEGNGRTRGGEREDKGRGTRGQGEGNGRRICL